MKTREEWLTQAVKAMAPMLEAHGAKMPNDWAISVGFPKRGFKRNPAIGECWSPEVSPNKVSHMFISPIIGNPLAILWTTLHEMIHAAVGLKHKHSGEFRRVARAVGLKGKLTATFAEEGTELYKALEKINADLGEYPGTPMKAIPPKAKQGWFLIKLKSPNDPSYKFTIAPRLLAEFGMPKDYMGDDMVVAD